MSAKTRTFTPVDLFVQTYIMDHPRDIEYHPGDSVSFKAPMLLADEIEELLKAVDDLGLSIHFEGHLVVWETPESDVDEEPEEDEETEEPGEATIFGIPISEAKIQIEEALKREELKPLFEREEPVSEESDEEEAVEIDVEPEEKEELVEI
jgi:hypothetical protein